MYNESLMQVFANPKNVGIIKNADGVGEATNELNEVAKIFIAVQDGIIIDAKFKAYGSPVVIASCSTLTTMIKNVNLDDAINISYADIIKQLGGDVEKDKLSSVIVAKDAMLIAIKNYKDKMAN